MAAYINRCMAWLGKKEPAKALSDSEKAITENPDVGDPYLSRAHALVRSDRRKEAVADFRRAIELNAQQLEGALNSLAWLQATSPDAAVRDGHEAVALALRACDLTKWQDYGHIDTLAAAYAESGDFDQAVATQEKAVLLTPASDKLRAELVERVGLYRKRTPYREKR